MTNSVLFSGNNVGTDVGIIKPETCEEKEPADEKFVEFGNGKQDIPDSLLPIKKRRFWSGTTMGSHGMIKGCSLQGKLTNRVNMEEVAEKRTAVGSDLDLPLMKRRQLYAPIGNRDRLAVNAEVVVLPPMDLKNEITSMSGIESSISLVIEKMLTASNVNPNGGRMSMLRKQMSLHLDQSEWDVIEYRDSKGKPNKINVVVIDQKLEKHVLAFEKWYYDATQRICVLCGAWNCLCHANIQTKGVTLRV